MQSAIRGASIAMLFSMLACAAGAPDTSTTAAASGQASDAVRTAQGDAATCDGGQARPHKGWCDTQFAITAPILSAENTPIGFSIDITGVCQLAHLGKTTMTATQEVTFRQDGTQSVENHAMLVAANGDTLLSAFSGTGLPVLADPQDPNSPVIGFTFEGTDSYSAGTGRFGAACGSAVLVGSAFFDPPEGAAPPSTGSGHYEVNGTITY